MMGRLNQRFVIHGLAVQVSVEVPALGGIVRRMLEPFAAGAWPEWFIPTSVRIRPYEQAEVLRHMSSAAQRIGAARGDLPELYQERERLWVVDEQWGISQVDYLRGSMVSWVLPRPGIDIVEIVDRALLWPLAQLLKCKDLHLIPAAAVTRGGFTTLVVSPFDITGELVALVRSGYRVVGQRWVAVREEQGRTELLSFPGLVKLPGGRPLVVEGYSDLLDMYLGVGQPHAFCDAVALVTPGRRVAGAVREIPAEDAGELLRQAWPIPELHPRHRPTTLLSHLSRRSRVVEMDLTRTATDVLNLMERLSRPQAMVMDPAGLWRGVPSPRRLAV